ncbi:transcription factor bHLH30-like [Tripterygium wilfordii]|uniref:Transcription factor bHLH30-like n=1 Tax=Tripterygium wilfordii TaxID=458696 RepID=A0A7J7C5W6_TRIWF|nr:transcription factor bHLH30-like [Tripterygium wilfordii]KAF5729166.1 transcription factor bHLH30-like [Tripterygium wilfordii]
MAAYLQNPSSNNVSSGYFKSLDPFSRDLGGCSKVLPGGSLMGSQSLVLDNERGELVKAPPGAGKKEMSEAKTLAALKSHSEAERRRRERINAHLATLRGLVPSRGKMDKATLLAEVISQVKELKKNALDAAKGLLIPMDDDEVNVEPYNDGSEDGTLFFRASLCCDYRPDLLSDLRQALDALHMKMVKSEVSTLAGRLKNSFIFTTCTEKNVDDAETKQLVSSVHQALNSVLDKGSSSPEYSPRTTLPNKRRRISFFDSSSSSL